MLASCCFMQTGNPNKEAFTCLGEVKQCSNIAVTVARPQNSGDCPAPFPDHLTLLRRQPAASG